MKPHSNRTIYALVLSLGFALFAACGEPEPTGASVEDILARERATAHFRLEHFIEAREELAGLTEGDEAQLQDLTRLLNVELADLKLEAAAAVLQRADAIDPDDPIVLWARYRIHQLDGEFAAALVTLEQLVTVAPDDFPTRLALATMKAEDGQDEAAEKLYRELLDLGAANGTSWQHATTYRMFTFLQQRGRTDEALPLLKQLQEFEVQGITSLTTAQSDRGTFGELYVPARGEVLASGEWDRTMGVEPVSGKFADTAAKLEHVTYTGFAPAVLSDDWPWDSVRWNDEWIDAKQALTNDSSEKSLLILGVEQMPSDAIAWGPAGLDHLTFRDSKWIATTLVTTPVRNAVVLDLDLGHGAQVMRDGLLDLAVVTDNGLEIRAAGEYDKTRATLLTADFGVRDMIAVDFDHDGDLDLLVVGAGGTRLFRNDGFGVAKGVFTDVAEAAGLPAASAFDWCLIEDFDADNDVDLLLGGAANATFLASNARGGNYSDRSSTLPAGLRGEFKPLVGDLNADGWTDIVTGSGDAARIAYGGAGFAFREVDAAHFPSGAELASARLATPFGEPRVRALWSSSKGLLDSAHGTESASTLVAAPRGTGSTIALADIGGDGFADLTELTGTTLQSSTGQAQGNTLSLTLRGVKDNRRGVGALVEVRAGAMYRRIFWDGGVHNIGLGRRDHVDILRITWPNGIVQEVTDLKARSVVIKQREGLGGSCPFLYTWNGTTYEFVSDVLGITPLGLPMAPGQLVPPDHDEFVLVRGDQLAAKDGFFEMQFTEELREVTYLDRIRLDVVDHPAGTEIYPNELFTFPPFPVEHTHTVRDPLSPTKVTDGNDRDWTSELGAIDGDYAIPFEPLFGQYLGLAAPHTIEIAFDRDALAQAKQLRLVLTGWFYWTDASVNVAAARTPGVEFLPPLLEVPDGEGGWRGTGPPIGFPAGKLKTMLLDVTDILNRDDPRVRLTSTLQLYWDSIRLATDDDDAELSVTRIEPASADLWSRGFSKPLAVMGISGMDWFEWDQMAEQPRWNQHPGLYTRYGETVQLLGDIDDRFVILGAGDALRIRFDATEAPPLRDGWVRDYLVFMDGWAKDRDPNTVEALYTEPWPFHGMTSYPYGDEQQFPDTPELRAWAVNWNTRPSMDWLPSLIVK